MILCEGAARILNDLGDRNARYGGQVIRNWRTAIVRAVLWGAQCQDRRWEVRHGTDYGLHLVIDSARFDDERLRKH